MKKIDQKNRRAFLYAYKYLCILIALLSVPSMLSAREYSFVARMVIDRKNNLFSSSGEK